MAYQDLYMSERAAERRAFEKKRERERSRFLDLQTECRDAQAILLEFVFFRRGMCCLLKKKKKNNKKTTWYLRLMLRHVHTDQKKRIQLLHRLQIRCNLKPGVGLGPDMVHADARRRLGERQGAVFAVDLEDAQVRDDCADALCARER